MQAIATAIGFVLGKIVAALSWIGELAVKAFEALWHICTDVVCWCFDKALDLVLTILNTFDFSGFGAYVGAWASLPLGVIEAARAIGVFTALGLIVTAITIRFTLQLIPFVRLGS